MSAPAVARKKSGTKRVVLVRIDRAFTTKGHTYAKGQLVPIEDFPEWYPGALNDRLESGSATLVLGAED